MLCAKYIDTSIKRFFFILNFFKHDICSFRNEHCHVVLWFLSFCLTSGKDYEQSFNFLKDSKASDLRECARKLHPARRRDTRRQFPRALACLLAFSSLSKIRNARGLKLMYFVRSVQVERGSEGFHIDLDDFLSGLLLLANELVSCNLSNLFFVCLENALFPGEIEFRHLRFTR